MTGITNKKDNVPARGERVANYVEAFLSLHPGLSLGELAFRLRTDKRDLARLVRDRSCGWRLEDSLAAYFGDDFVEALFSPVIGNQREIEIETERAEIAARNARLQIARSARAADRARTSRVHRMASDEGRQADV